MIVGFFALALVMAVALFRSTLMQSKGSIDDFSQFYHDDRSPLQPGAIAVTFIGVSTLLFEDTDTQILVDAFFTRPPALKYIVGARSNGDSVDEAIDEFNLGDVDAVFVSHSHIDHALDIATLAAKTNVRVYGSESTLNIVKGGGVHGSRLVRFTPGGVERIGAFGVTILQSPHSPEHRLMTLGPPDIDAPLTQPANLWQFAEGGSHDFVITHGEHTLVVKASANYVPGSLRGIKASALFLATARLGKQDSGFQEAYLDETIRATDPETVVPLHWDDFLRPWRRGDARLNPRLVDSEAAKGLTLVRRASVGHARFVVLQAGSRLLIK